jgi:hypothetical protein
MWIILKLAPAMIEKVARGTMLPNRVGDVFPGPTPYAARHLAQAVVGGSMAPQDLKTFDAWARHIGLSAPVLRRRCCTASTRPKLAHDFTRLLRVVRLWLSLPNWSLGDLLDVGDDRTVGHMLERGQLDGARLIRGLTCRDFCQIQGYVRSALVLEEVAHLAICLWPSAPPADGDQRSGK